MFAVSSRFTEAGAKRIANERRATPRRDALIAASQEWERKQKEAAEARRRAEYRRELAIAAMERAIPKPRPSTPFDARNLIGRVAAWYGFTVDDVLGPSRAKTLVQARFDAVAAVAWAYPEMSLPMLGRIFKRDHTTILHALKVRGLR